LTVFTGAGAVASASYKPDGTNTLIYDATANSNEITSNGLVDWTDIDTCMATIATQTDAAGQTIVVPVNALIVPYSLISTAARILNATGSVYGKDTESVRTNGPNPVSAILGGIPEVMTSPLISTLSEVATDWYLGSPKDAFLYREHWPFQAFEKRDPDSGFDTDVVIALKFREWGTPHCVDHRFMYRNAA